MPTIAVAGVFASYPRVLELDTVRYWRRSSEGFSTNSGHFTSVFYRSGLTLPECLCGGSGSMDSSVMDACLFCCVLLCTRISMFHECMLQSHFFRLRR